MWILIMTLAFSNLQGLNNGGAGAGGAAVATAEFSTEGKCKAAGYKWEASIIKYDYKIKETAKWICVQK